MRPDGLHHVSLNVRDVPATLDFYTRVLGLTERGDRPDFSFGGAWLDAGGQQIHLIEADVPPSLGQHFALAVSDLDAVVAELRGQGVTVTDPVPVGTGGSRSSTTRPGTGSSCRNQLTELAPALT